MKKSRRRRVNITNPQQQESAVVSYIEDSQQVKIDFYDRYYLENIDGLLLPHTIINGNNDILTVAEAQKIPNPPFLYLDTPDPENTVELKLFLEKLIKDLKHVNFVFDENTRLWIEQLYNPYLDRSYALSVDEAIHKLTQSF